VWIVVGKDDALEDMKQDVKKLPVKADGTPDFVYMETYIQKNRTVAMDRISILQSLKQSF
jgi:hypothetical protein